MTDCLSLTIIRTVQKPTNLNYENTSQKTASQPDMVRSIAVCNQCKFEEGAKNSEREDCYKVEEKQSAMNRFLIQEKHQKSTHQSTQGSAHTNEKL